MISDTHFTPMCRGHVRVWLCSYDAVGEIVAFLRHSAMQYGSFKDNNSQHLTDDIKVVILLDVWDKPVAKLWMKSETSRVMNKSQKS